MDTSTPLAKVKAASFSDFRCISSLTDNKDDENTLNNSPIVKVFDSVFEESDIVLTQRSDGGCNDSVSETISPISEKIVPSELLQFLDTPNYKWTPSIMTNYPTPSQDVKELSEDHFIHDVDVSFEKSGIAHYTTNSQSRVVFFDEDETANTNAVATPDGHVSPVFTQRKTKKSSAVNKNLFPTSNTALHDANSDYSCTLIDSHSFGDVTLNALTEACCDADLSPKKSPTEGNSREDISSLSLNSSFELSDIKLPVKNTLKSFIYPCGKVKKPEKNLCVDDIMKSVLPLEQSSPITQRLKSQLVPRGLISFSELNSLTAVNEYENSSLPLTACDEMAARIDERIVTPGDEQTKSYLSFPTRFCHIITKDRDIYDCLKKYFEYHRVAYIRTVWQANRKHKAITTINYIESGKLKSADEKAAFNHLKRQLRFSEVPLTLVVEFFDFFRINFRLVYNFNIRKSIYCNRFVDAHPNRRGKRNRCRLEFEKNILFKSCRSLNENLEAKYLSLPEVTSDICQSPLRKMPRTSSSQNYATRNEDTKLEFLNDSMYQEFFADFELDNDATQVSSKNESVGKVEDIISSENDKKLAREKRKTEETLLMESTKLDDETLALLFSDDVAVDWNRKAENIIFNSNEAERNVKDKFSTCIKIESANNTERGFQSKKSYSSIKGNIRKLETSDDKFFNVYPNVPSSSMMTKTFKKVDEQEIPHRNIFESTDDDWLANADKLGDCLGFSTACGKAIKVDEKLLQHRKRLFDDLPLDFLSEKDAALQVDHETKSDMLRTYYSAGIGKYSGFDMACKKSIKFDEKLLQGGEIFDDLPPDSPLETDSAMRIDESKNRCAMLPVFPLAKIEECFGFNTASGKAIKVDEKLLRRGKKLFEDLPLDFPLDKNAGMEKCPGFNLVSGKPIKADEKLLQRGDMLDDDQPLDFLPEIDTGKENCSGFNTASGKAIKVDEKLLRRRKKLFDDLPLDFPLDKNTGTGKCTGFNIVSGKPIDEKLSQSGKVLFDDLSSTNFRLQEKSEVKNCPDFNTASGKAITVDEKLLRHGKKLFDDLSLNFSFEKDRVSFRDMAKCPGFNTASGKAIQVDEKLLQNRKKLLDDLPLNFFPEENAVFLRDMGKCPGFSTASGKAIKVDEKLLQHGKRLFDDLPLDFRPEKDAENYVLNHLKRVGNTSEQNIPPFGSDKDSSQELFSGNDVSQDARESKEIEQKSHILYVSDNTEQTYETSNADMSDITRESLSMTALKLSDSNQIEVRHSDNLRSKQVLIESSFQSPKDLPNALGGSLSITEIERSCTNYEKIPYLDDSLWNPDVLQKFDPNISSMRGNIRGEMAANASVFVNEENEKDPLINVKEDQEEKQDLHSRNTSPVFESNKMNRRRKNHKRKSHSLSLNPLNVTYLRNDDGIMNAENTFKMLNDSFVQRNIKRKDAPLNLENPSLKKSKVIEKNDIAAKRKDAEIEQQNHINNKNRNDCKQRMGSIMNQKMNGGRRHLKDIAYRPQRHSVEELLQFGVKPSVINVNSQNASDFTFTKDFLHNEHTCEIGLSYGDECFVIPNENDEVHFEELARAFLASPGVDPQLISINWIRNHYRWIVWKLAALEKSFPSLFGGKYLTLDHVLYQLKFRYDWEVDRCQRSALKRILECDDSPSKSLVLCVAGIKVAGVSSGGYEIELTDGWYSVFGQFDDEMRKVIADKKIAVGTKILVMNGELIGLSEGCDPLEISSNVRFKVATNSVRRVRWDTRLGFYYGPGIKVRDLKNVLPHGGVIPVISASIARIYPVLYLEKKLDGSYIRYNEKMQFKKFSEEEKQRQTILENLMSQVTREVEKENKISCNDECQDLLAEDVDSSSYQAQKYGEQEKLRFVIEERVKSRFPEELKQPSRVSRMIKVRLTNCEECNSISSALLTIWQASDDLMSLLFEEQSYNFLNIVATDRRNGELQLSSNRLTRYELQTSSAIPASYRRRVTAFNELKNDFKPSFGEVDIVGIVIKIEESNGSASKLNCQTIFISDLRKNIIAVSFRSNIKDFGLEDILKPKRIIACLNLQWKKGFLRWQIPILFSSDLSSFVCKSRHRQLQNCINKIDGHFRNQCLNTFVVECEEKINQLFAYEGPAATSTPHKMDSKKNSLGNSFAATETSKNTSTCSTSSFESSNSTRNLRSKSAQSRIDKLRVYGEPPPLSPISISTKPQRTRLSVLTRTCKPNSIKDKGSCEE